jgi:hypothetical protein
MLQNQDTDKGYIPGTCNIGKEEIKRRRNGAIFSGILSFLLVAVLLLIHAEKFWRLVLFFPVTSFVIGVQQWYYKFCMGFGMKGIFNFEELGKSTAVKDSEMVKADKRKAVNMLVTGLVSGIIIAIIFYMLP